ncbi:shikimate dehydrogenase family protein [Maribacter sp. HTCC2170]|uniref:shikimate dehydrogenase family protein n=1 Tax=Maribacter sp. (strain HTCC2170 / KCCM 42371) TaxID=313603 RepID=UPI00006B4924|nr:shikimate dehydrogenase [Maribacter sp. HTCC2170]EAR00945.1 putative shikimate 5-dehydrogenase [Maribacter sp. HTCC2170]
MENIEKSRFGLVGKNISYSFSKGYFTEKFKGLDLQHHSYENFDLTSIEDFQNLINQNNSLKGLNVTIPYKEAIIPYLDKLNKKAKKIGAVNTLKFTKKGLKGYNTDIYGFKKSIEPFLKKRHKKALILGTGGASKAVAFVFNELGIKFKYVSRTPGKNQLSYSELSDKVLRKHTILVNCTPQGTFPNIADKPNIPYEYIAKKHLLFDLIYNPEKTAFLLEGQKQGASICNGLKMLELQAEKSWKIWNS